MYLIQRSKATSLGFGLCLITLLGCDAQAPASSSADLTPQERQIWPQIDSAIARDEHQEAAIVQWLEQMTLEQKVGQMIQAELKQVTPEDVKQYHLGSILNGGGSFPNNDKLATIDDWLATADAFYHASMDTSGGGLAIPVMWGTDAVHGHNNVVGATLFPHNIGLGATHNPQLIRQIGAATAREVAVTGIDWVFAPTVATVRDDRWGRTYEGYSETPALIKQYAEQMTIGLQGSAHSSQLLDETRVVATAKHFIGDGGTLGGIDRGNNLSPEQELFDLHGQGYVSALSAGVQRVMASFNSWQGEKLHGSQYLLTEVLKNRMGFDGFVVGDWNGHAFVPGCSTKSCPQAINAGLDMFMAPDADWKELYHNTIQQVRAGDIPLQRIDDAVSRILRVKLRAGLFDKGAPSTRAVAGREEILGSPEHRAIARQAVRESLVLLKNKNALLPLDPKLNVLVAGDGADHIGKQSGGWTLSWQGTGNANSDFPGATSIFDGIESAVEAAGGSATLSPDARYEQRPDVAIVVFGEDPYAEGQGDVQTLEYQPDGHTDLALLKRLKAAGIPVISVFLSGRPLWVNKELNASDAFVAAWLPGSEGAGVADVLFRQADGQIHYDFVGKLTFSWPNQPHHTTLNDDDKTYQPLFAQDYGLSVKDQDTLTDNLAEVIDGAAESPTDQARSLFVSRALPPWQLLIGDTEYGQVPVNGNTVTIPQVETLTITAINKEVQEDARQVLWSGRSLGEVLLQGQANGHDLTDMLQKNGALSLELRIDSEPTDKVHVRMDCGSQCTGSLEIRETLLQLKPKQWLPFSIDLRCFAQAGADFTHITKPLVLTTRGELSLSFANVKLEPGLADRANYQCGGNTNSGIAAY
ncbi:glycoside hydrolase family 3 protein [Aestuariicella hydrocarbonica]|uniref:Glycoside hydrolase family 3 protein n=1 Tax=Pseudomaricurvus hydrocarbonicus TaxID=1470433 RepID=A0A9E5T3Y7_9GAMM|nr:glycoside hydrolase family 3 N-terminal domain-containing protein [Aestuariicella hydrocarbonica]NHO67532.1 glycoside hydrolase family 3 protein [Aestuariicella hydrocarbonica]